MANVRCSCLQCSSELGCFRNSWTGIGNSYFSPVYPPVTYINGFEPTGEVFAKGPDGSAVQNSILQDLACRKCAKVIGLICNDAPAGHLLKKNQLILRLAEMHVVSEQNGEKATISVQQKIPLVAPGTSKKYPSMRRAATLQPVSRQQTPVLTREGDAMSVRGSAQSPARLVLGKDVARFSAWAEDAIRDQQRTIDRISGVVNRIERDIISFKDFIIEVRAELKANRATRNTQQESNQEQLAWVREDLKELRQENGKFQQDLQEEELPNIRNQLDQLRQEIDYQEQMTGLSNNTALTASTDDFTSDLLEIRHKASEVDELRLELRELGNRLVEMEEMRPESFNFPRTLMNPKQTTEAGCRMTTVPDTVQHQCPTILQASGDCGFQPMVTQQTSPTGKPPGAFPDFILEPNPTDSTSQLHRSALSIMGESHEPVSRPLSTAIASPKPVPAPQWSYTGSRQWRSVKVAFETFDLEYPKGGVSHSVKLLEDHINDMGLQNTVLALKHGKLTSTREAINTGDHELHSSGFALRKRKRDQIEAPQSDITSEGLRKLNRQPSRVAEVRKESTGGRTLTSPSTYGPDGSRSLMLFSACGSPELGRDSRFRSLGSERSFIKSPNGTPISENTKWGASHLNEVHLQDQPSLSNTVDEAQNVHRRQISHDELQSHPTLAQQHTPASRPRYYSSNPDTSAPRNFANDDQALMPGAFPGHSAYARAALQNTVAPKLRAGPVTFDPRTDKTKHFKCGCCGKKYRNPSAFKYHKNHSSCNDDPRDESPKTFTCPYCGVQLRWGGLQYHVGFSACSRSNAAMNQETPTMRKGQQEKEIIPLNDNYKETPNVDEDQYRNEVLAARERLAKETLETEI